MTEPFSPAPMPFLVLLDEAMRRVRTHLRAIFPAVAFPVAILTTLLQVAQTLSFRGILSRSDRASSLALLSMPLVLLVGLVLIFVSAVAYVAGQVAALDGLCGRPIDMRRAWRFGLRLRVWWTLILLVAAIGLPLLILVPAFSARSFLAIFFSVLLALLLVIFVALLLSFVIPVMVEEGAFGLAALSRSADLVRFNPSRRPTESPLLKVFVLMLVTTLIGYLAGFLVALPFQLPMIIDMLRHALSGDQDVQAVMSRWLWLQVPAAFLGALVRMAVYLYTAFGIGMLFFDVRGRKEGSDLRSQIDSVFGGPPPPPLPLSSSPPPPPVSGEPWP
jgi:hypothetical protein